MIENLLNINSAVRNEKKIVQVLGWKNETKTKYKKGNAEKFTSKIQSMWERKGTEINKIVTEVVKAEFVSQEGTDTIEIKPDYENTKHDYFSHFEKNTFGFDL